MFDTTKEDLKAILKRVGEGKLQLPDFQRDYVWDEEDVRSLIASVVQAFPVGALLTLESGGPVEFKPRLLAGVKQQEMAPEELLLDGQQRMTSLYQAMISQDPVRTRTPKGRVVERYFYLDIERAVDGATSLEDVIVGVPRDRVSRTDFGRTIALDLSTREREFEHNMFPLRQVFDNRNWLYDWRDYWRARGRDVQELERDFYRGILEAIDDYKMPIIKLGRDNGREAICLVFEKVNVGGKKLDAFELVTAIYAASKFDLREDWHGNGADKPGRQHRMIGSPNRRDVLTKLHSTDFLQACTLLHTRELRLAKQAEGLTDRELPQISMRRDALLGLPLEAYLKHADGVEAGFIEASTFLNELNIVWHKDIPYPPQLVGLAAAFALLSDMGRTASAKERLTQWFWSGALGEMYGAATETRLARDVPELVRWIESGGPRPRTIEEAIFQRDRLLTLKTRLSAAYKGIHASLMGEGCLDFISGKPTDIMTFFNDQIDIHHVFPRAWCARQGIPPSTFNSIVNKTPLSKQSNIAIGGDAPSLYLRRIEERHGLPPEQLDRILRTHLIEPAHLRNDDFVAFFEARTEALAGLVAKAMGKPVVSEQGANEEEHDLPPVDEEELEAELEVA